MIDLGRQFQQRIRAWQEELDRQVFTPVGEVAFEGFVSTEILRPAEAARRAFRPFPAGTRWGGNREYGWFRAEISLPAACEGKRVVLFSGLDGEQIHYIGGRAAGAVDREHPYVTLTRAGKAGERFSLLAESYAGHGPRLESGGPCPPERRAVPDTPETQCEVRPSMLAVWNEEAYQLKMDLMTLTELLKVLPDTSLRAQRVAEALDRMTHEADLELPEEARTEAWRAGRACLREALACRNGSTAPEMRLIGQSHIDLAWLWPREETYHKVCRTYATQLALMEEYPGYQWLLVEPALLDMLRDRDGDLWERVKEAARRGQIHPEGAFYVECDTNIPGGESLIRQLCAGKEWFRAQFGVESRVAWLPDCFGFSAALPQIFRKMGIPYFATQKLLRADPECETFPWQHFIWEGLDGSETEALSFMRDNGPISPFTFYRRWDLERTDRTGPAVMLHPFGYGDGGGGPTRDMVEMSLRLEDLEGTARSRYSGLREYFEEATRTPSPHRWVGELYLAWHRGTWTSQRRNKALIRRAEEAIHNAELADALAPAGDAIRREKIRAAWKELMFNQFHDVAGGVGLACVHAESEAALTGLIGEMEGLTEEALGAKNGEEGGPVVFNPLAWPRTEPVRTGDGGWRWISAPAGGTGPAETSAAPGDATAAETEDGFRMENRYLRLRVDRAGRIVELTDLENGLPLLNPGQVMNDWRLYQNVQSVYDGWELDRDWPTRVMPGAVSARVRLTESGPKTAELEIHRSFGSSRSLQRMRLYASSRRIDFETETDWQERHRMLKAHFESSIHSESALHEIQFGHIARPAHRSGAFASDRYEVCQQRWSAMREENRGFALLNDGIFALSADRDGLALTLLRAPLVPAEENNRGIHRFTYALYPWTGTLEESGVVRAGYELNNPLRMLARGGKRTGPRMDSETMILETVRRAADGEGWVLRIYQSMNANGEGRLILPFDAEVYEISMDERERLRKTGQGREIRLTAKPFEILTLLATARR